MDPTNSDSYMEVSDSDGSGATSTADNLAEESDRSDRTAADTDYADGDGSGLSSTAEDSAGESDRTATDMEVADEDGSGASAEESDDSATIADLLNCEEKEQEEFAREVRKAHIDRMLLGIKPSDVHQFIEKNMNKVWDDKPQPPWVLENFSTNQQKPPQHTSGLGNHEYIFKKLESVGCQFRPGQQISLPKEMTSGVLKAGFLPKMRCVYTVSEKSLAIWDFMSKVDPKQISIPINVSHVLELSLKPEVADENNLISPNAVVVASTCTICCYGLKNNQWVLIWDLPIENGLASIVTIQHRVIMCSSTGQIEEIQYLVPQFWTTMNFVTCLIKLPEPISQLVYEPTCQHLFGITSNGEIFVIKMTGIGDVYSLKKNDIRAALEGVGASVSEASVHLMHLKPVPSTIPTCICISQSMHRIVIRADAVTKKLDVVHVRIKPPTKFNNFVLKKVVVLDFHSMLVSVEGRNEILKTALINWQTSDDKNTWKESVIDLTLGSSLSDSLKLSSADGFIDDMETIFLLSPSCIHSFAKISMTSVILSAFKAEKTNLDDLKEFTHVKQLAVCLLELMLMPDLSTDLKKVAANTFSQLPHTSSSGISSQLEAILVTIAHKLKTADFKQSLTVNEENSIICEINSECVAKLDNKLECLIASLISFIQAEEIRQDLREDLAKVIVFLEQSLQKIALLRELNGATLKLTLPPFETQNFGLWIRKSSESFEWCSQTIKTVTENFLSSVKHRNLESLLNELTNKCIQLFTMEKFHSKLAELKVQQYNEETNYSHKSVLQLEILTLLIGALPEIDIREGCNLLLKVDGYAEIVAFSSSYATYMIEQDKHSNEDFSGVIEVLEKHLQSTTQNKMKARAVFSWVFELGDKSFIAAIMEWLQRNSMIQEVLKPNSMDEKCSKEVEKILCKILHGATDESDFYQAALQLSWFYKEHNPLGAVDVLLLAADDDEHSLSLEERHALLTNAMSLAKTTRVHQNKRAAVAKWLGNADLQLELLNEAKLADASNIIRDLSHSLMTEDLLLSHAKSHNLPFGELLMLQKLGMVEKSRISALWKKLLPEDINNEFATANFIAAGKRMEGAFLPIESLINLLEEKANCNNIDDHRVLDVLLQITNWDNLVNSYLKIVRKMKTWTWTSHRILSSALLLIEKTFCEGYTNVAQKDEAQELVQRCKAIILLFIVPTDPIYKKLNLALQICGVL